MIRDARAREGGDESASPRPLPVPSLDVDLAERLRRSADARIAEQIEAGRRRTAEQQTTRATFTARRRIGVDSRNAARAARLRLTAAHQQTEETP